MFSKIARLVIRRSKLVLASYLILVIAATAIGINLFANMKSEGYDDPQSDSATVLNILDDEFDAKYASIVFFIDTVDGVDNPRNASAALEVVREVTAHAGVDSVVSYWTAGNAPALRSDDTNGGLVLIYLDDLSFTERSEVIEDIATTYDNTKNPEGPLTIYVGGGEVIYNAINTQVERDLIVAESIAIPLNILLLLLIFGSVIASGLPMIVALGAIAGSLAFLYFATSVTDISIFAMNLITGLGLGLGVDYALLIVNRFREELAGGKTRAEAIQRTIETAGRTVYFSGLTVALVLLSLAVFPQYFLRSFAWAGVSVVALAVLSSLFALPAVLYLLGVRVDKYKIRRSNLAPSDEGAWAKLAKAVMHRPLVAAGLSASFLLMLASPMLGANFGQIDDRALPKTNSAAQASEQLRSRFTGQEMSPIEILLPSETSPDAVKELSEAIAALPEVTTVEIRESTPDWQRITVVNTLDARSSESMALIQDLRNLTELPSGTLVGGDAGVYTDSQLGIARWIPTVALWLVVVTGIVVFLFTGSILLPLKAILLNALSLSATLGILVWIFQEGNLAGLLGDFTVTGQLDTSVLTLIIIVAFGLSMDYELFLLSRIKEEHDHGADTVTSVSLGLQRSGRIITAAALLIAAVFAVFVGANVTSIKMLGLGIAVAILLDATVVRGVLVPALMRIAGSWNWWAPKPLAKLHSRFGLKD